MEFPQLGDNCGVETCNQLDFLPLRCDACHHLFCKDHLNYDAHNCPEAYRKNRQVPVCPLCDAPVVVQKGQSADAVMSDHIDNMCKSDPALARRNKIFVNKCCAKGCKKKELMPIRCDNCGLNFCVKHRVEMDHHCEGREAALQKSRMKLFSKSDSHKGRQSKPSDSPLSPSQATKTSDSNSSGPQQQMMDEDRDLALALQLSLQSGGNEAQTVGGEETAIAHHPATDNDEAKTSQEDEDFELAKALHESEMESNHRTPNRSRSSSSKKECSLS